MLRVVLAACIAVLTISPALAHGALPTTGRIRPSAKPVITVIADAQKDWIIRYRFDRPVTRMAFDRTPDGSRIKTWTAPPGFQITRAADVNDTGDEIVSRVDGNPFRAVDLRMPPRYRDLPSDYAPFAPFGDGSILFYTGRLFACGDRCAANAAGIWSMRLIVRDRRRILLNGRTHTGRARWRDSEPGRFVYLGNGRLTDAGVVNAVIDQALPGGIRQQLEQQLPVFMAYFSQRLGALETRPALFASYDAAHPGGGWGRQGGTLPGQIFTHFYGNRWPAEFSKPDFSNDLAWHFAHEAGHLHQRGITTENASGWWIHEGGAEAFAAIALRQLGGPQADYVDRRIKAARESCGSLLRDKSLHQATSQQSNVPAYQCGLLVNLALDSAVRQRSPDKDGLYSVWRAYLARRANGQTADEAVFLASVAEVGGQPLAEQVAQSLDAATPDFSSIL
jgi:hypothetical protein